MREVEVLLLEEWRDVKQFRTMPLSIGFRDHRVECNGNPSYLPSFVPASTASMFDHQVRTSRDLSDQTPSMYTDDRDNYAGYGVGRCRWSRHNGFDGDGNRAGSRIYCMTSPKGLCRVVSTERRGQAELCARGVSGNNQHLIT